MVCITLSAEPAVNAHIIAVKQIQLAIFTPTIALLVVINNICVTLKSRSAFSVSQ